MDVIDDRILEILKNDGGRMSLYKINKTAGLGWSTTKTHLLNLQVLGKVDTTKVEYYTTFRSVWWAL